MATEKRLIDANRLKKVFEDSLEGTYTITDPKTASVMAGTLIACGILIDEQPTVDAVEVVHGRWVLTPHEEQCNFRWNVTAECSECQYSKGEIYAGHFSGFPKHLVESLIPIYAKKVKLDNYCPNCGAKMDGDGNG